jgi:hypothetical protein
MSDGRAAIDVIGRTVVAWECGHDQNLEFCNAPGTRRGEEGQSCQCQETAHAITAELKAAGYEIVAANPLGRFEDTS